MTDALNKRDQTLILASASPRREKLLGLFEIPFRVVPSSVDENIEANRAPADIVQALALRKARDVAQHQPDKIVIGADTIVVHDEAILGKPGTPDEARMMLGSMSNSTHRVLTGLALVQSSSAGNTEREQTFYESTEVTFGELDEKEIERYVAGGSPMDKAGAYGIQDDWGAIFVKGIVGDYYNIVGLPLHALYHQLKTFAPHVFGDTQVKDEKEVAENWEILKMKEGRESVLDGIPPHLPALIRAQRMQEKAGNVGFDWKKSDTGKQQLWDKLQEELDEFKTIYESEAEDQKEVALEYGDLLFSVVNAGRFLELQAEDALRLTNKKFQTRFRFIEEQIKKSGKTFSDVSLDKMEEYWQQAKSEV